MQADLTRAAIPRHEAGDLIGGRYRLQSPLGEGGMGSVWQAEHVTLHAPVAVKFISSAHAASEDALARFMLEAQSAAALRSTHIVQVFDFGVDNGSPYMAMELLDGESLATRLLRERRLSPAETARILSEAARAVEHAHQAGIVHRDLKPDNIFLVREANIEVTKVLDFGIAKVTGDSLSTTSGGNTATGAVLGTPFYLSPEQARGTKAVDRRSDLWALGVIVYECLLGARPFRSTGLGDLVAKICCEPHPVPSEHGSVPRGFDEWVARALAKEPHDRFQSATEMSGAFTMLLSQQFVGTEEEPIPPTAPSPKVLSLALETTTDSGVGTGSAPAPQRGRTRFRSLIIVGGIAALAAVAAVVWSLSQDEPATHAPAESPLVTRSPLPKATSPVTATTPKPGVPPPSAAATAPTTPISPSERKPASSASGRARAESRPRARSAADSVSATRSAGPPAAAQPRRPGPSTATSGPGDDSERAARALFEDRK